jgi:hypothetical protein
MAPKRQRPEEHNPRNVQITPPAIAKLPNIPTPTNDRRLPKIPNPEPIKVRIHKTVKNCGLEFSSLILFFFNF